MKTYYAVYSGFDAKRPFAVSYPIERRDIAWAVFEERQASDCEPVILLVASNGDILKSAYYENGELVVRDETAFEMKAKYAHHKH